MKGSRFFLAFPSKLRKKRHFPDDPGMNDCLRRCRRSIVLITIAVLVQASLTATDDAVLFDDEVEEINRLLATLQRSHGEVHSNEFSDELDEELFRVRNRPRKQVSRPSKASPTAPQRARPAPRSARQPVTNQPRTRPTPPPLLTNRRRRLPNRRASRRRPGTSMKRVADGFTRRTSPLPFARPLRRPAVVAPTARIPVRTVLRDPRRRPQQRPQLRPRFPPPTRVFLNQTRPVNRQPTFTRNRRPPSSQHSDRSREHIRRDDLSRVDTIEAAILKAVNDISTVATPTTTRNVRQRPNLEPTKRPRLDSIEEAVLRAVIDSSTLSPANSLRHRPTTRSRFEASSSTEHPSTSQILARRRFRIGVNRRRTSSLSPTTSSLGTTSAHSETTRTSTASTTPTTTATTTSLTTPPTSTSALLSATATSSELVLPEGPTPPERSSEDLHNARRLQQLHDEIEQNFVAALDGPHPPAVQSVQPPGLPGPPSSAPAAEPPSDDVVHALNQADDFLEVAHRLNILRSQRK
ncbi:unnamed protein product [Caenorhabditis auriculariae]|uniref:Uncharacterized protein n=1 Tax=Caenorhabditis auriculariae TaxID=2777116 RepID=A0A8S1GNV8_9PELO|nr:unnamed protein product [Caenorhabditis auriculariae]